jgi:hypothetical protein
MVDKLTRKRRPCKLINISYYNIPTILNPINLGFFPSLEN